MAKKKRPFEISEDVTGNNQTLFIPERLNPREPILIEELKELRADKDNPVFWRVIDEKGKQLHSHGWMIYNKRKKLAEITQWG